MGRRLLSPIHQDLHVFFDGDLAAFSFRLVLPCKEVLSADFHAEPSFKFVVNYLKVHEPCLLRSRGIAWLAYLEVM